MTFNNTKTGYTKIIAIAVIILLVFFIMYISFVPDLKMSGIFRSGSKSNATEIYQVYPVKYNGEMYLISVEGVFKTTIYSRKGGITQRSGTTSVRLTLHNLQNGNELNREVVGDYYDAKIKLLGKTGNTIWYYDIKNGLHSRNLPGFKIEITEQNLINANAELAEGLAKPDVNLNNADELYAVNEINNTLQVTTLSGKKLVIDAASFKTQPNAIIAKNTGIEDEIDKILENAEDGNTVNADALQNIIRKEAANISGSEFPDNTSTQITGADNCKYSLEGNTIKTIIKSGCPQPALLNKNENNSTSFIESKFLASPGQDDEYINPPFLGDNQFIFLHAASVGRNVELLLSKMQLKNTAPDWTCKTGIKLNDQRSGYTVHAFFGNADTLFISIEDMLLSINMQNGKIFWKKSIASNAYGETIYFIAPAQSGNKKYFLIANSYLTNISKQGFITTGTTAYQFQCIDAASGKTVNKINGNETALPFYLGMSNGKYWFYSSRDKIHTRSIPELTISDSFASLTKNAGYNLVNTENYEDAFQNRYVIMDEQNNTIYFVSQTGKYYALNTADLNIKEAQPVTNDNFKTWIKNNTGVQYYNTGVQNVYNHELTIPGKYIIKNKNVNSVSTFNIKEINSNPGDEEEKKLSESQFIDGIFLVNAVSLDTNTTFTARNNALRMTADDRALYILNKDKIAPDAHLIISKYNTTDDTVSWKYDLTARIPVKPELIRIYTYKQNIILIFKTRPALDDNFVCVALDANSGNEVWNFTF